MGPKTDLASNMLGWLAVRSGRVSESQLQECLAAQRRARALGGARPLGAMLVDRGLLDEAQLAELLAEQQFQRGQETPAQARLTERENQLLGQLLITNDLIDTETLETCARAQAEALEAGASRKIGEILIDFGLLEVDALRDRVEAALTRGVVTPVPVTTAGYVPQPPDHERDAAFVEQAMHSDWVDPERLERLENVQRDLAQLDLHMDLAQLAIDVLLASPDEVREVLVERPGQVYHEPLRKADDRLLLSYLADHKLAERSQFERADAIQQVFERHGVRMGAGDVLLRMGLLDPVRVPEAIELQRLRKAQLDLFFGVTSTESGEAPSRFLLKVVHADREGQVGKLGALEPGRPLLIGRAGSSGLRLIDASVSKSHARVLVDAEGRLQLTDLGSSNGTLYQGQRISQVCVGPGEVFWLGNVQLQFLDREHSVGAPDTRAIAKQTAGRSSIREMLAELELEEIDLAAPRTPRPAHTRRLTVDDTQQMAAVPDPTRPGTPFPTGPSDTQMPAEIREVRAVFREFYARDEQLKQLDVKHSTVRRMRTVTEFSHEVIRAERRPLRRAAIVGTLCVLAVALAVPITTVILGTLRDRRLARAHPPTKRPPVRSAGPAEAHAPKAAGVQHTTTGVVRAFREYDGPDGPERFGFFLEEGPALLPVRGQYRVKSLMLLRRAGVLPLDEGGRVEVDGVIRAFSGPPARLPDGRVSVYYLELTRLDVLD